MFLEHCLSNFKSILHNTFFFFLYKYKYYGIYLTLLQFVDVHLNITYKSCLQAYCLLYWISQERLYNKVESAKSSSLPGALLGWVLQKQNAENKQFRMDWILLTFPAGSSLEKQQVVLSSCLGGRLMFLMLIIAKG